MPVHTPNKDYNLNFKRWKRCRDVVSGEETVKNSGEAYLPKLGDQTPDEYDAYKMRAQFFAASERTVKALTGVCMKKDPQTEVPESFEEVLATIGPADESLNQIVREVLEEVISIGRVGVLVDIADDGTPYICTYRAESIINWRTEFRNGQEIVTLVVIKEMKSVPTEDPFVDEEQERYRVLYLDGNTYTVDIYRIDKAKENGMDLPVLDQPTKTPKGRGGKTLDYIPFTFVNPSSIRSCVEKSPIADLVGVNLSHYRTSADLEHGQHFSALPTAWVAGFPADTKLRIGASTAWVTENTDAKAGFLEFTGAGLGRLAESLQEKKEDMAILGARLLQTEKAGVEAADAILLRQSGEKSVLETVCETISQAITRTLRYCLDIYGQPDAEVNFAVHPNINTRGVQPQVLATVMSAYQSGIYSYDSWFWFLKQNELLPDDRTQDEEQQLLAAGPLVTSPIQPPAGSGGDNTGSQQDNPPA